MGQHKRNIKKKIKKWKPSKEDIIYGEEYQRVMAKAFKRKPR